METTLEPVSTLNDTTCPICKHDFVLKQNYIRHTKKKNECKPPELKIVKAPKAVGPDISNFGPTYVKFNKKGALQSHPWKCMGKKDSSGNCMGCGKVFTTKQSCIIHIMNKHYDKPASTADEEEEWTFDQYKKEYEVAKNDIAVLKKEKVDLNANIQKRRKDRVELQAEIASLKKKNQELEQKIKGTNQELEDQIKEKMKDEYERQLRVINNNHKMAICAMKAENEELQEFKKVGAFPKSAKKKVKKSVAVPEIIPEVKPESQQMEGQYMDSLKRLWKKNENDKFEFEGIRKYVERGANITESGLIDGEHITVRECETCDSFETIEEIEEFCKEKFESPEYHEYKCTSEVLWGWDTDEEVYFSFPRTVQNGFVISLGVVKKSSVDDINKEDYYVEYPGKHIFTDRIGRTWKWDKEEKMYIFKNEMMETITGIIESLAEEGERVNTDTDD